MKEEVKKVIEEERVNPKKNISKTIPDFINRTCRKWKESSFANTI